MPLASSGNKSALKFTVGDRVFVDHGTLYYEAKVLDIATEVRGVQQYNVHYNGWNSRHDENVSEKMLLKYNDTTCKAAKELHDKMNPKRKKAKIGTGGTTAGTTPAGSTAASGAGSITSKSDIAQSRRELNSLLLDGTDSLPSRASSPHTSIDENGSESGAPPSEAKPGKTGRGPGRTSASAAGSEFNTDAITIPPPNKGSRKRGRGTTSGAGHHSSGAQSEGSQSGGGGTGPPAPCVESLDDYKSRLEIKVNIPDDLKPVLVDDWDLVTRQFKLIRLPTSRTVRQILEDYMKTKSGVGTSASKLSQIGEISKGVREYFDVMLGTQLLYKYERLQYADVRKEQPGVPPSSLYGAVHLLRLFVRLGHMLAYTPLSEKHITLILGHVHDLIAYLRRNKSTLFPMEDYITAPPHYQREVFSS